MTQEYLLKGVEVSGQATDLLISGEIITQMGNDIASSTATVIDCHGSIALPGLVDLHTHLREPGKEDAETVLSGSRAGARGGYVALSAMANTSPVADTAGVVEQVFRLGQEAGLLDVFPVGAVTQGLRGEHLAEIGAMADSVARVRIFSDDGNCVADPLVMRRALEYVKKFDGVIAQHAQEPRLTQGSQVNEGFVSSQLGLKGWPAIAEEAIIARDVLLADHVQARLHICHVTTRGGVEIIRWAKSRGIDVTAEVTPHHLLLTDEASRSYDPIFKVNPPLRTESDVMALREALAEGVIDIVATDHAPHAAETKECEWQEASFGMLGLETALPIVNMTLIQTGLMNWDQVAERMSSAPARIGRYGSHGRPISEGERANIVVMNPTEIYRVDRDRLASRSRNTPFHGMEIPGVVKATFFNGQLTYKAGE
jgi:dihydroorotase